VPVNPDEQVQIAVIGGSGLYKMEALAEVRTYSYQTPFGKPSDDIVVGTLVGARVAFIARHGRGHQHLPSQVPYKANFYALKELGVRMVLSVSACGSLREDLHPGEVVVPDQLFDQTKSRANTFFGDGLVAHISVADPFCPHLSGVLAEAVESVGRAAVHRGGKLITIEGPRFSTRAESEIFRRWGMDIINMTTCPEAFLAREAEMCYAVMNTITDYDVWHETEGPVTVEMVVEILRRNAELAQLAIEKVVARVSDEPSGFACECADALGRALITEADQIPRETREKLGPLVRRYLH
jgi:5'-methylthioadenosine phosphorylase